MLAVPVLAFAGYVAIARGVGDLYPFSTFGMYSSERLSTSSRIVAVDAAGRSHEIDEYSAWDCDGDLALDPSACPAERPFYYIPHSDREAADFLKTHQASGRCNEPVAVVRRIWRLSDEAGPPPSSDCVLLSCRAVR